MKTNDELAQAWNDEADRYIQEVYKGDFDEKRTRDAYVATCRDTASCLREDQKTLKAMAKWIEWKGCSSCPVRDIDCCKRDQACVKRIISYFQERAQNE